LKTWSTRALGGFALVAAWVTAPLLPGRAAAQEGAQADTAIVEIEGTSVLGARPTTTRSGSSVVRAAIDSLPVPAAASLRQVLEQLPAVHVRTNSRGESEISLRGSESRQVSVLYDGMPLTLSWDGRTDVSVIPVGAMQQVSLVPGLSTLLSGPNVLGGVIEFQSTTAASRAGPPRLQAAAGVDEVGGFGATASLSAPRAFAGGVLTLRAGLGHRDTPGATLADGVVQPVAGEDLRINTDATATNGFAAVRFDRADGGWASFTTSAFREERGIAAELGSSAPRYWRYPMVARSLNVLSGGSGSRRMPWGGAGTLNASFGFDVGRTEIDAFDSIEYDTLASEEDGDQRTMSLRVTGTQTLGRNADLRVGVTSSELTYDESLTPGATNRYRHRLWSVGGETIVRHPVRNAGALDEIDLGLGVVFDRSTNPLAGDKPAIGSQDDVGGRLGVSALFGHGAVTVHANVNRRARFPALRELYSGALDRFMPNPSLQPEKLTAGEVGVTLRDAAGSLQVVGFAQRLEDAVVRIRQSGLFKRVNQEGLRTRGMELVGSRRFGRLSLGADLTVQTSEFVDPGATLENPENLPEVSGALRAAMELPRDFSAGLAVRHTGDQFALDPDSGNLTTLEAATRVDAEVGRTWRFGWAGGWASSVRTTVAAENLTDEAVFDAFGLPGPGRLFRFEVRVQ
jgi:iron complex outermembrane receptor protein